MTSKPTRQPLQILNKQIETTLAGIGNNEVKANYAKAVIMATKLWSSVPSESEGKGQIVLQRPCSAEHIKIETRLNYEDLRGFQLLLVKNDAIKFLKDMGKPIKSESSFSRSYSKKTAGKKLDRKAAAIGDTLVCTYAEWLYMTDFAFEPLLPEVVFQLIPEGWKCPDPEGTPEANLPL